MIRHHVDIASILLLAPARLGAECPDSVLTSLSTLHSAQWCTAVSIFILAETRNNRQRKVPGAGRWVVVRGRGPGTAGTGLGLGLHPASALRGARDGGCRLSLLSDFVYYLVCFLLKVLYRS